VVTPREHGRGHGDPGLPWDQSTLGAAGPGRRPLAQPAVAALLGRSAVCVGGVVRNQIVAVIGCWSSTSPSSPRWLALAPDVGRFGPTAGAPNGIVGMNPIDGGELLAPGLAVVVMLAWIAEGFAAAAALLRVAIWCDAW
jgi:hypothetical protein